MTMLDLSKMNKEAVDFSNVDLTFQLDINQAQASAGIIGKVLIHHPAFTTRATLYKSATGIKRVSGASIKTNNPNPEMAWFNIVTFESAFREFVLAEYEKEIAGTRDKTPWYQRLVGEKAVEITAEQANETLDIQNIFLNLKLTENQAGAGMLCKVNVKTSIGTIRGYSVYKSKFGSQLYGIEQEESEKIKAYTLSREAEAQVLNFIHPLVVGWGTAPTPKAVEVGVPAEELPVFDPSIYE